MVVISGNITLMARAARIVWTCNPCSGAMPAGNANWKPGVATGALAAHNSASVGLATFGAPAGADPWAVGVSCGISARLGASVLWAYNMAPETTTVAAPANQRPRPLAN